ncbi:MAG: hypothetical protein QOG23_3155 [Blastocatellia bacterium]|jgi:hypothetical protein|nr:hypothetical protein [Blastocatellia bacterium]
MRRTSSLFSYVTLAALVFIQSGCPFHKNEMRPIGPEVKASLVIYFKLGITDEQIEDFWHRVLSKPDPQGRGYNHRGGVGDISRISSVQGHEGIALTFLSDATNEERETIMRDIKSSPLVYRVLENIAPADVKKIE